MSRRGRKTLRCYGYTLLKVTQKTPKDVKTKIYKLMNGTTVTIRGKRYKNKGLINDVEGVKLANSLYAIPTDYVPRVLEKLSERKLETFVQLINLCRCTCE
ncbi:MAG: hypothetical protein QW775_08185 [Ignisphaera sp.]|uniref:Uncharacterized protein n=1 Tax=Ignisphaera aggregans TaxID=334771 RepID=A0A7C4NN43_9CREN